MTALTQDHSLYKGKHTKEGIEKWELLQGVQVPLETTPHFSICHLSPTIGNNFRAFDMAPGTREAAKREQRES